MPLMFMEPTNRQITFQENKFDEKVVLEHAMQDISHVIRVCEEKLPNSKPHTLLHLVRIDADKMHQDQILHIYLEAVNEENRRLKQNGTPIHLSITNGTGGEIYFVAGTHEPIELPHIEFPLHLDLSRITPEAYSKVIRDMKFAPEEKEKLLAFLPKVYEKAERGEADLADIFILNKNGDLKLWQEIASAPSLTLDKDTKLQLKSYIDEILQKQAKEQQGKTYVQRLGNAIIRFFDENLQGVNEVERIKTPQELANEMIAYKEGKRKTKPTAKCVDISLLTNELLKMHKVESAVLSLHAIDEFGDEQKGHATAAVAEGGWVIDPALKNFAFQIKGFTLDKGNKNYNGFSTRMNSEYLSELQNLADAKHPLHDIEFHLDTEENELQAMFLVENGSIMQNRGDYGGAFQLFKQAYELNNHNFYAARYYASSIRNSNPAEAARVYKECAVYNPSLYLANYFAAVGLSNISVKGDKGEIHPFMEDAYRYGLEAVKRGGNYYYANLHMVRITTSLGYHDKVSEYKSKQDACKQPPEVGN